MAILAQLQRFLLPGSMRMEIQHFYIALVDHARNPVFYTELDVPDTLDGRFDMITLHVYFLLNRLKRDEKTHQEMTEKGRLLIEAYLADMARSLREMGVGDTGVARRIQRMASAFYGRMEAYIAAAKEGDDALKAALKRNVYGTSPDIAAEKVALLADFVRRTEAAFDAVPNERLKPEALIFPPVLQPSL